MYIVTGAAGLIGSGIVWGLNQRGIDEIICVDNLGESDKWKNLRALRFAEYEEKEDFREMIQDGTFDNKKIDAIIHMGACSSTTERDASYLIDNNYKYTQELAAFAVSHDIRFIYASSCATYGDGSQGYLDDESKIEQLRPMNMYGYSKQMFDLWAKHTGLLSKITGLKFSNVYGSNEMHKAEMRSVVCRAYEQISATGKMALFKSYNPEYADGEQMRDFIYVKDVAKANLCALVADIPESYEVYNVCTGVTTTIINIARIISEILNVNTDLHYVDSIFPVSFRLGSPYKAKEDLDFDAKVDINVGLEKLIIWIKDIKGDFK